MNRFLFPCAMLIVSLGCDDISPTEFILNEHYVVVDIMTTNGCPEDIEISYQGNSLSFVRELQCNGSHGPINCPSFYFATNHIECIDNWQNCRYIERGFILTDSCRLLIDVDAVKATWTARPSENLAQVTNQPNQTFHVRMQFTNLVNGSISNIDEEYLPLTFDQYDKCHNGGNYKFSEYSHLYECFNSLSPHHVLTLGN